MRASFTLLFLVATAALAIALLPGTASGQNLVTNGDFATGDLSGWTVDGDDIEYQDGYCGLGTINATGTLSQSLTSVSGSLYKFTFTVSSGGGNTGNSFSASLGSTVLVALDAPGEFDDVTCSYCYTATQTATNLTFAARNDPSYWNIDDISVVLDSTCTEAVTGPCAGNVAPSPSPSISPSPSPSPSEAAPSVPSGASQLQAWWTQAF
jgi:hypothetical protein